MLEVIFSKAFYLLHHLSVQENLKALRGTGGTDRPLPVFMPEKTPTNPASFLIDSLLVPDNYRILCFKINVIMIC